MTQNGDVENRVIDLPIGVTPSQLIEASNFLNAHIQGRTITEARQEIARLKDETQQALDQSFAASGAAGSGCLGW